MIAKKSKRAVKDGCSSGGATREKESDVEVRAKAATEAAVGEPPDAATARDSIKRVVRTRAVEIVEKVIDSEGSGRVAQAKFLFEIAGVYPPREESRAGVGEESLAQVLLGRLNLPVEPVVPEKGLAAEGPTGEGNDMAARSRGFWE